MEHAQVGTGAGTVRFLDSGETALVVEFGTQVDPDLNAQVLGLHAAMTRQAIPGLCETVPTYRSLMIHYDPLVLDRSDLCRLVSDCLAGSLPDAGLPASGTGRLWTLPCCYDPERAEDLGAVAAWAGLTEARIAELHGQARYRVYMYGFAPGFAYLGGLPDLLAIPRRETPRPPHPANAILLGGGLAAVATFPMPTGWYVIGRTPERLYSEARPQRFFVEPGDSLRFEAIDAGTFAELDMRAALGEVVARSDG